MNRSINIYIKCHILDYRAEISGKRRMTVFFRFTILESLINKSKWLFTFLLPSVKDSLLLPLFPSFSMGPSLYATKEGTGSGGWCVEGEVA